MTAVDLDALDAARAAATPGPWENYYLPTLLASADAALIVAAVNALPELVAEARQLRALREAVEGLAGLVEQGRAWTGDSLARRLRAIAAALTSEGERE